MLDVGLVATGFVIGVVATAPVGPVNIMTIQRAFRHGFFAGLSAGIGAVIADALYASLAAFGVTAVSTFITDHVRIIQVIGALVMFWFGWRIYRTHPHLNDRNDTGGGLFSGIPTAFLLTITNPGAVFGFIALIGGLGDLAPAPGDWLGALQLVGGLVVGSLSWWMLIAGLVTMFRSRLDDRWLERINHAAAGLLFVFGVVVLVRAFL
ncbi:LysE family translocator [Rhizobiales bacterium Sp-1]|uniref:LysE family translocator n=1 Tax=Segnochrobactrum spirostomi TaxID=2608987 RepID=A0A6A7Y7K1_9HYPH|nr:LysE family translocator [Segnochrobactrum spirostomi]